jgi:hypothetical protein
VNRRPVMGRSKAIGMPRTGMKVIVLLAVALLLAAGMGGCRKPDTPNIGIVRGFLDGPNLPGAP